MNEYNGKLSSVWWVYKAGHRGDGDRKPRPETTVYSGADPLGFGRSCQDLSLRREFLKGWVNSWASSKCPRTLEPGECQNYPLEADFWADA